MSLNVDFNTGGLLPPDRQLYKLLTKDRRVNKKFPAKPCFGKYAFAEPMGAVIKVGDSVEVTELFGGSGEAEGLDTSKTGQSRKVMNG